VIVIKRLTWQILVHLASYEAAKTVAVKVKRD
jgi:hypothetical protein